MLLSIGWICWGSSLFVKATTVDKLILGGGTRHVC